VGIVNSLAGPAKEDQEAFRPEARRPSEAWLLADVAEADHQPVERANHLNDARMFEESAWLVCLPGEFGDNRAPVRREQVAAGSTSWQIPRD
jgi:hypothetical protein